MIVCVTPNPAIDRTLSLPVLTPGSVHRAEKVMIAAGGKGLNVARALRTLGGEPLCMGFVGGRTGRLLADLAQEEGLRSSWTWVQAETRNCAILITPEGDATVINEPGAPVTPSGWQRLHADVSRSVSEASMVCVSGSLPSDSSPADVRQLLDRLVRSGKPVWVDTSGAGLEAALSQPGVCIKVNGEEIGKSLGFPVHDPVSAERALTLLHARGIDVCIITLGAAGAILGVRGERWYAQGKPVPVVSTVGSGDSFLAGLVYSREGGSGWADALCDAVAAGTANAFSAGGGRFTVQEFQQMRRHISIRGL